jgi:NAD(P)-dependent dehydrogenase (short-subunit alcohol dehydrogenase family)
MRKAKRHALIIGGTKGLGLTLAAFWKEQKCNVSVLGRSRPANLSGINFYEADLAVAETADTAIERALEEQGKLDSLVFYQRFRGQESQWTQEMDVSLHATKRIIDNVTRSSMRPGRGSIVVINSLAASMITDEATMAYHVSKAALLQLVRYYAARLAQRGIRVNSVSPGMIYKKTAAAFFRKNKKLRDLYGKIIPMGRMGSAQDIADAVDFLCSDKARYVTGQNLVVDGGLSLTFQPSLARLIAFPQ